MRRILVATVGGQPSPIVTAIRENAPLDRIVFLCSAGPGEASSAETVWSPWSRRRRGHCPHCQRDYETTETIPSLLALANLDPRHIEVASCDDPDDLSQVLATCEDIETRLRKLWPGDAQQIIANYTGGTKTMSLGLGLFALRRRGQGWTLQLNRLLKEGRSDLVRIQAGDQPVAQDSAQVTVEAILETATWLQERHHADAAAALLSSALAREAVSTPQQEKLLRAQLRSRLISARDDLDFPLARRLAGQDRQKNEELGPWLQVMADWIENPIALPDKYRGESCLRIVDELCRSAEHLSARGDLDNALERWILTLEVLVSQRCQLRGLEGRAPDLETALDLLDEHGDALGRYGRRHRLELQQLLGYRRSPFSQRGLAKLPPHRWRRIEKRFRAWLDGAQEILW